MGPTHFYGARAEKNQKNDFAMKQTNICRLSGYIKTPRECKARPGRHLVFSQKSFMPTPLLSQSVSAKLKFDDILSHGRAIGLNVFSTAVLTLNFDLDLSKVSSEISTQMLNICDKFRETKLVLDEKSQRGASRTSEQTDSGDHNTS